MRTVRLRRIVILAVSLFPMVTAGALAQSSERATISELQQQLAEMRSQMAALQNRIATLEGLRGSLETATLPLQQIRAQPEDTQSAREPTASHLKGFTVTPGGFLDSTVLLRTRNENADVATSY